MKSAYKILVVDDDDGIKNLLCSFLASRGHICEMASDGIEALDKAGRAVFDAIITDIKMPRMDGITLTRELVKRCPGVSIMAMTGFSQEYSEEDAIDAGVHDFITKPFTLAEFSARFHKVMRDHRIHAEIRQSNKALTDEVVAVVQKETEGKIDLLKKEISELKDLAHFDTLTKLPNRRLFFDSLSQSLESAKRYRHMLALLYLDLDNFKVINDTLGHDAGDLLLKKVVQRVAICVRKSDIVARMGGDEFTVILVHIDEEQEAAFIAHRIIDSLSKAFRLGRYECSISGSIGISIFPADGDTTEILLKKADTAMFSVKRQGRNNYRFYEEEMGGIRELS
ncbi:MAG: diguanylate cyclase [Thermodesulfovibrionales bacterium]|jgi:diguanylate cyclase (GGDEF)-like protein